MVEGSKCDDITQLSIYCSTCEGSGIWALLSTWGDFWVKASSSLYFAFASFNSFNSLALCSSYLRTACDLATTCEIGMVGRGDIVLFFGGASPSSDKSTAGDDRYPRLSGLE